MEETTGLRALIFTGGYSNIERLRGRLDTGADWIIAADSGYRTAVALGIRPHIAMGDFDSYRDPLPPDMPILRVPAEKDVTDTMLACEFARDKGCRTLTVVGGTGGRVDHSLSNLFYLESLRKAGIRVTLTDGDNTVRPLCDERAEVPNDGGYFSVFALDRCVVTETGCKYPLERAELRRDNPYAVSNEVEGEAAVVEVEGAALLVTSRK